MADIITAPAAETASVVTDNNASGANTPGAGETITLQERPEWVPEKFFKDGVVNFREMAKSYGELEKSKAAVTPVPDANAAPKPDVKTETTTTQETITIPGVDAPSLAKFTEEMKTDGKLSPASYEALTKLGYPKVVVDSYIKGMTADADAANAVSQARIADKQISEITSAVGGEKVLGEMLAWATSNLDAADLKTYNDAVGSSDVSKVKMAVNGLYHAYSQTVDPALLQGDKAAFTTVEPFNSNDEVVVAMQNPLYDRDPAYRAKVAARIAVSDVFKQSRDTTHESFLRHQS